MPAENEREHDDRDHAAMRQALVYLGASVRAARRREAERARKERNAELIAPVRRFFRRAWWVLGLLALVWACRKLVVAVVGPEWWSYPLVVLGAAAVAVWVALRREEAKAQLFRRAPSNRGAKALVTLVAAGAVVSQEDWHKPGWFGALIVLGPFGLIAVFFWLVERYR